MGQTRRAAANNSRPKPGGVIRSLKGRVGGRRAPPERQQRRAGVDDSEFKPGDMIRFLLIMELSSDLDANYKHIHTLKGIGQKTLGPWTQYEPILCVPATAGNPCTITPDVLASLNVRPARPASPGQARRLRTCRYLVAAGVQCQAVCCAPRRAPSPGHPPRRLGAPSSTSGAAAPPPRCACGARARTVEIP